MSPNSFTASRAPRLLVWTETFWPRIGGGESWSLRLLQALQARGYDIKVIEVGRTSGGRPDDPLPVARIPVRQAIDGGDALGVARARAECLAQIRAFQPDVALVSAYGADALAMLGLLQSAMTAPLIAAVHAEWPATSLAQGSLAERLLSRAASIVVFDEAMAGWLSEAAPELAGKLATIEQALDDPGPPVLPAPRNRLLFCGRFTEQKGGEVAIAAFARLAERFPELRLDMVGDGILAEDLRAQAAALPCADRITFHGPVPFTDMPAVFDRASVVIMPSRFEPFGLVALEAAWRARPVVASAVGGLTRVIADGETGRLCPIDDAKAFADAVADLIGTPELADRTGAAARGRAKAQFNWSDHVDAFEALIGRAMRESASCVS